jgi:nucleoid DNA-binding protein
MQTFKFEKKQLNFSQKWCASVSVEGEHVTSEGLVSRLMVRYGYTRKELQKLMECLRTEIMAELMNGNSVELFDMVKFRPDYSIRNNSAGDEHEVEESLARLTPRDVKTSLKVKVNQSFNHEFVRLFRKKNLATLF